MKKRTAKTTKPITMEQINTLMAALGITDQDIDELEKEQEEEDRLALEKWDAFCRQIRSAAALQQEKTGQKQDKNA